MGAAAYARTLLRWWWLLIAAAVIGGVLAYLASGLLSPTYHATTRLIVTQQPGEGDPLQRDQLETSQMLAETYSQVLTARPLLEEVIERGGFDLAPHDLREMTTVEQPRSSQLIEITVEAGDAELAADLANAIATVFIQSDRVTLPARLGVVNVLEAAQPPGVASSPQPAMNAVIGALLAVVLVGLSVTWRATGDDTVRGYVEAGEPTPLPLLGDLRHFGRARSPEAHLRVALDPQSSVASEYRGVRATLTGALGLDDAAGGRGRVVLFTSPRTRAGTSTAVANTALVFGSAGYRVLVIDADLYRPALHDMFGVESGLGLSSLLLHGTWEVTRPTAYPNVSVIPVGPEPAVAADLLGAPRLRSIVRQLRDDYDLVIVDGPAVLEHADSLALATLCDSVVLVVRANETRQRDIERTIRRLALSRQPVAGVIINDTDPAGILPASRRGRAKPLGVRRRPVSARVSRGAVALLHRCTSPARTALQRPRRWVAHARRRSRIRRTLES